jgi:hypothetical protein
LHKQVLVIGHHHERVDVAAAGFDGPPQPTDPFPVIGLVAQDPPPLITPRHHVVKGPGKLDPQRSGHTANSRVAGPKRKA